VPLDQLEDRCRHNCGEAAEESAAKALCASETVDHDKVYSVRQRTDDGWLGIDEATFIEAAAAGASTAVFPMLNASPERRSTMET
jgi:hypothetical protein